jgi:hypothetical protein
MLIARREQTLSRYTLPSSLASDAFVGAREMLLDICMNL